MEVKFYYNKSDERQIFKELVDGVTLEGNLRDSSSIISPTIMFTSEEVMRYNFCYIPQWQRYYFVRDIQSYRNNLYVVSLECDVLMSFKGDIANFQVVVDKQTMSENGDEYIDDGSLVCENVMFNKQLFGKPLNHAEQAYLNAAGKPGQVGGEDARGGYLIPAEQQTQIHDFRRDLNPLKDYCNVISVATRSGSMPIEVSATDKLTNFEELNEITQSNVTFGNVKWTVADYGDIIPVSNTLLADEKANLTSYLGRRFAKKAVRTENAKILELLSGATAKTGTDYKAIKTMLNKELDPAIATDAVIICNQTTFDWLDQLEDSSKHPLLQPMLSDPTRKAFAGHEVIVVADADITQSAKNYVLYIGNLSEYIAFFDRQGVEMAVSTDAGFTKNATLLRVVERFDVQKVDANAMVKLTITVS